MHISRKQACRGDGHAYIKFTATNLQSKNSVLRSFAHTNNDLKIPSEVYVISKNDTQIELVLVLPLMDSNIRCNINEFDSEGKTVDTKSIQINPNILKWESRVNYRLNKENTLTIRDFEHHAALIQPEFKMLLTIDSDEEVVCQMKLTLPNKIPNLSLLKTFDENYKEIEMKIIPSSTALKPLRDNEFISMGESTFSIVMPKPIRAFVLYYKNDEFERGAFFGMTIKGCMNAIHTTNLLQLTAGCDAAYASWFQKHRMSLEEANTRTEILIKNAPNPLPTFSIIVPLYKTPKKFLYEMYQSVASQSYYFFELILINIQDANKDIAECIIDLQSKDSRVKVINLETNLGITRNTYYGIQNATGNYICFLDHDDTIELNALYEYAHAIVKNPSISLLYSDEDKLLEDGTYSSPYFKPDFSLYLLREMNYVCHFLCAKKTALGGLNINSEVYDGAQDHNLTLQISEIPGTKYHVRKVLYHWRMSPNSTAANADQKPYATYAAQTAIQRHLQRQNIAADVELTNWPHQFQVKYKPTNKSKISIIIPTKDNSQMLNRCIDSILTMSTYPNFEILLIENNSTNPITFENYERLKKLDTRIKVFTWNKEFNFSSICNFGSKQSTGEYLLFLNNDTKVITPTWLEDMLGICQQPDVGAVGVKLYFPDNTIQHVGVGICKEGAAHLSYKLHRTNVGYFANTISTHELSCVTAACLMTPKDLFGKIKGFDEQFAVAFNDVDLCLKIRKENYLVIFSPWIELYHYESISRGEENTFEQKCRFNREAALLHVKWPEYYVNGDPYLNPNFDPMTEYFQLRKKDPES